MTTTWQDTDDWAAQHGKPKLAHEPPKKPKRPQSIWRPMTADELAMARALGRCNFAPATFTKKFAADIYFQAAQRDACEACGGSGQQMKDFGTRSVVCRDCGGAGSLPPKITDKQAALLVKLIGHYRKQIAAQDPPLPESCRRYLVKPGGRSPS